MCTTYVLLESPCAPGTITNFCRVPAHPPPPCVSAPLTPMAVPCSSAPGDLLRCTISVSWHTLGGPSPDHWVYVRPPAPSCLKPSQRESAVDAAGNSAADTPSVGGSGIGVEGPAVAAATGNVDGGWEGEGKGGVAAAGGGSGKGGDGRRGGRVGADPFALFRAKGVSFQVMRGARLSASLATGRAMKQSQTWLDFRSPDVCLAPLAPRLSLLSRSHHPSPPRFAGRDQSTSVAAGTETGRRLRFGRCSPQAREAPRYARIGELTADAARRRGLLFRRELSVPSVLYLSLLGARA